MRAAGVLPVAKKRNDVSVKIDAGVHRKLRTVAAWKGRDQAEYLSEIVEAVCDRELAKMGRELTAPQEQDED